MNILKNKSHIKQLFVVLLFILIFVLHFNILDNEATNWDDPALFTRSTIHSISIENLKDILIFHADSTHQPVRDLSYMIDFSIWGDEVVLGMHLHSILLYFIMILICWLFLKELFISFGIDEDKSFLWASISSLIYALHPIHVESTAWLYARKEPLLGIFTFLSLWTFLKARSGKKIYYGFSILSLVLAALSKPTALMIPIIIAAIDLCLLLHRREFVSVKKRLIFYGALLIIVVPMITRLITMMASAGGIKPYHGGSFWTNLLAVSQILVSYIRLIAFTIIYTADYPIKLYTDPSMWQPWAFVMINVILIGSCLLAIFKRWYIYAIFVAWYYIFLLPVSHVFPISQTLTDRYGLLSALSWCVLLGFIIIRLWDTRIQVKWISKDFPKLISVALLSMIVIMYSAMTIHQNDIWQDSQTLWENTIAKYPNSSSGNVNLAQIYIKQRRFQEAQELCINAIIELPYDYLAMSNLALAQMMMGQYDNAINNYQQALKLKPDLMKAKLGLANSFWAKKDFPNAYKTYKEILAATNIDKTSFACFTYFSMGISAWKIGKIEEASMYYEKAGSLKSCPPEILKSIGNAYTSMGDNAKALEYYQRAKSAQGIKKD
jgi:Tfp pilus assembly protein PilF